MNPNACSLLEVLEPRRLFSSTSNDMVLHWNEVTMDVLRADHTRPGPGWSSRSLAITSIAVFDAVNAIDRSFEKYLVQPRGYDRSSTSMDAAIASAAHDALAALYPDQKPTIDAELVASLATVPDGARETRGVQLGSRTARAILAAREHDGSDRVVEYTINPAPGHWQPDPINPDQLAWGPGWGQVESFALNRDDQFQAPAPPKLDSAAYAAAYNEVKSLGAIDSTTRTADQTQIGNFWAYDRAGMGTPPGMYCQQTEVIATQQHNTTVQNARLFALVNIAQADSGFAAWNAKFKYDFWRPITAIRRGAEDGNPATTADQTWQPLGAPGGDGNPNFSPPFPAYVSGHATFGAAVYKVLADFYHTDRMHFTLYSDEMPGITRGYTRFSQASEENARSRIYLGIHWSFDADFGEAMGRKVGDWTIDHELEPVHFNGHRDDIAVPIKTGASGKSDRTTVPDKTGHTSLDELTGEQQLSRIGA